VRHLVYPVPDARFPFLGVHLTRTIHGAVHVGPNAVLSMAREGYGKTAFNFSEAAEMLRSNGFWGYARRHWRHGLAEASTGFNLRAFTRRLQRLVPDIQPEDLIPLDSGVRAQAVTPEGALVDDFQIIPGRNSIHVCNAAAPAATASLEIGRHIAQRATQSPGFPALGGSQDPWSDDANCCEGICEI
jgi:L-2-hydroxyglutarate oxidase